MSEPKCYPAAEVMMVIFRKRVGGLLYNADLDITLLRKEDGTYAVNGVGSALYVGEANVVDKAKIVNQAGHVIDANQVNRAVNVLSAINVERVGG